MELHIGREIESKFRDSGLKHSEFAKRLRTSTRNVYSIFERKDINTSQLKAISEVLKFDFFTFYRQPGDAPITNEPLPAYQSAKNDRKKVTMVVELDGLTSTLDSWLDLLKKVNSAIS